MRFGSLLDAIGNTPLVELRRLSPKAGVRLFAKLEGQNPSGSLKDRIALYMIRAAEESGELTPDKTIIEPTSGNTGLSLAMIARIKGYRLLCVLPDNVTPERVQLLRAFGAAVVFAEGARSTNDAVFLAQRMLAEDPDRYYMPYQYGNANNPRAHYETTAAEIIRDLAEVDLFIAGLGTGGTLTGVGRRLKEHSRKVKIIAAVPHPDDLVPGLRSLDEGFIPPVLDESVLDGRIVVDSRASFGAAKELMEKEGIFAGVSAGAVLHTARKVASRLQKANIVCLLADGGWKYLSTELWTKGHGKLAPEDIQGKVWW